jgi:Spy/CpxP family protein refolding chaperone
MNNSNGSRGGAHVALVVFLLLLIFSPTQTHAQQSDATSSSPQIEAGQEASSPQVRDADLPRLLNLSPEQVGKIKTILAQDKDEWRAARQRLNQSQRALDRALYQDNSEQGVIEARSRDVTEAQATVGRLRAIRELNIRRVLTPEQLGTLRDLRFRARNAQRQQNRLERQQRRMGEDGGTARRPNLEKLGRRQNPDAQSNNNVPATTTLPRTQNEKINRQLMTPRERRAERQRRRQL